MGTVSGGMNQTDINLHSTICFCTHCVTINQTFVHFQLQPISQ